MDEEMPTRARGYPLESVPNIDSKFVCGFCSLILKKPIQSYCGHRFCQECVEERLRSEGDMTILCPSCQGEGTINEFSHLTGTQMFPDNAIRREFNSFDASCTNESCGWKGNFKQFTEHEKSCMFKPVACHCGQQVGQNKLDEHLQTECELRNIRCPFCQEEMTFTDLILHNTRCSAYPVVCPHCETADIPRNKLRDHQNALDSNCTNPLSCPYCKKMMERTVLQRHMKEDADVHVELLRERVEKLESLNDQNREPTIVTAPRDMELLYRKVEALEQAQLSITQSRQVLYPNSTSPEQSHQVPGRYSSTAVAAAAVFPTTYLERNQATAKSPTVTTGSKLNYESLQTKVNTFEEIVVVLNNEMETCLKQIHVLEQERKADGELLRSYEKKFQAIEMSLMHRDVALAEQDLRLQGLESTSFDGVLLWKITDFEKKRQDAISGRTLSFYSPVFYTSRNGYKMCARIYLNGDGMGRGTHISLFFVVMRGHFDDLLKWPFRQKVTMLALDQKGSNHHIDAFRPEPSSSSFRKPLSEMNIASGCPLFLPFNNLQSSRHAYAKDDTLFIKIVVDNTDI